MDFSFEPDRNGGFDQDLMHANMGFAFEQDRHAGFDEDIMRAFVREDGPSFMRDVREAILENMSFGVYPSKKIHPCPYLVTFSLTTFFFRYSKTIVK